MKGKRCMVTGGAGFIGSALVRHLAAAGAEVLVVDKLTYAGHLSSLPANLVRFSPAGPHAAPLLFLEADICDMSAMQAAFSAFRPDTLFHLAAESHVDRSIEGPDRFVRTNVQGTATLLQAALAYWRTDAAAGKKRFRFHHVSTDEVYGSLDEHGVFTEETPYAPRSPYAATKAGSDHLVRAWHATYGLPVVLTHASNTYGPRQHPEKLIPRMVINACRGEALPVYGTGANVRDWLHVEDHAAALCAVNRFGRTGETYNVGADAPRSNLDVVRALCAILDACRPRPDGQAHASRIAFVADRPGHDFRYALDAAKIRRECHWRPRHAFGEGLRETVRWYLENENWWAPLCRTGNGEIRGG